jgi:DNA-3-methyladenine glycosylase II
MTTTLSSLGNRFVIAPSGRFSLEEVAVMGFGHRHEEHFDGVLRLAFCLDGEGYARQGAVAVRQDDGTEVECVVVAGDPAVLRDQVSRILSLDHDGEAFDEIGGRDPVIGRLQAVAPGLRPPLFHSPYEAAAWAVLSARRPAAQMAEVRRRLSTAHGAVFKVAGQPVAAFPTPTQLLDVSSFADLSRTKIERLHAVARAARDGLLDAEHLRSLGPDEAMRLLQALPGIGPFYAALVVVRGSGFTDVLATNEPKLLAAVGDLYGLGHPASPAELTRIAEAWRPRRTWASVLVRAAHARLTSDPIPPTAA